MSATTIIQTIEPLTNFATDLTKVFAKMDGDFLSAYLIFLDEVFEEFNSELNIFQLNVPIIKFSGRRATLPDLSLAFS